MAVMVLCLVAIVARLFFVQGVDAASLSKIAQSEYVHGISFMGERGAILDRNGDELALSLEETTVVADPHLVTDPEREASMLSSALGLPQATLQADLTEDSGFAYLAHTVPSSVAAKVTKLINKGSLPGVYTIQEPKRFYPAGQLASPLLGMVGTDGNGLSGLEYKYNTLLAGRPGKLVEETDPDGSAIPGGLREYQAPVRGDDLVLSIDEHLQYDTEQALARALVAANAQSGMALIMSSKTGELLAVADLTMPSTLDPVTMHEPPALPVSFLPDTTVPAGSGAGAPAANAPQPVESPSASAFTTVYEPGSVEKAVTVSAALQSGSVPPNAYFNVPNVYYVADQPFFDAWEHPTLYWSIANILAHSSDIGTIQIAQRTGMPTLTNYMHAFELGRPTDIGFPGESGGIIPTPAQWSGTSVTESFGQGMAVTAIQMLDVYNTIANGGNYLPPRLVDGYLGANGAEHLFPVPAPHRVVSKWVARDLTSWLEGVVRVGTGTAADLSPYTVAGKTGTALVPGPHGYIANDYVSSFAGFVPAEDPAITAMVVVEGTHQYGAQASAPVFAMIARDALQELGIPAHKAEPQPAGLPQATAYGGEGEAADPIPPGLSGAPIVSVPSVSGKGQRGAPSTTTSPTTSQAPVTGQ